ncbi:MAG TPA: type II secretion system F family protein [bacterium]|nr:type II secretion system F family protein [bacterium]
MGFYKYKAKDRMGNEIRGSIDAQTERAAIEILKQKNIFVVTISPVGEKKVVKKGSKVKRAEIVTFARQMATMINAGLPILEALTILNNQSENEGMKKTLAGVIQRVESGFSLADAFGAYQKVFGPMFVNMIHAGESSGKLPLIMGRLAGYIESIDTLNKKIKSAMMYPVIVTSVCLMITFFLIVKVIPVFAKMYTDFGGDLPLPTKVLIMVSDVVRNGLPYIVALGVAGFFLFRKWARTDAGGMILDQFKLKVPIFGILVQKIVISRFAKTLSVLITSGIPILSAIDIVKGVVGNKVVEGALDKTAKAVREGEGIAVPLSMAPVFPTMVVKMIEVGEKTGNLEDMLDKLAEYYDNEVNSTIAGLTSLIEPLLIVFLGVVIGGIMICMFLPIFKLSSVLQNG